MRKRQRYVFLSVDYPASLLLRRMRRQHIWRKRLRKRQLPVDHSASLLLRRLWQRLRKRLRMLICIASESGMCAAHPAFSAVPYIQNRLLLYSASLMFLLIFLSSSHMSFLVIRYHGISHAALHTVFHARLFLFPGVNPFLKHTFLIDLVYGIAVNNQFP